MAHADQRLPLVEIAIMLREIYLKDVRIIDFIWTEARDFLYAFWRKIGSGYRQISVFVVCSRDY